MGKKRDKREDRMLYFAYGSNLNVPQMQLRCPDARMEGPGVLRGWKLVFRGVADIVPAKGSKVHGAVWSITPRDLVVLDRYEGFRGPNTWSLYYRRIVTVYTERGAVQALVYIMTTSTGERMLPSQSYLDTCMQGLAMWSLPSWHLKRALKEAGDWLLAQGITRLERDGKRMRPVRGRMVLHRRTWPPADPARFRSHHCRNGEHRMCLELYGQMRCGCRCHWSAKEAQHMAALGSVRRDGMTRATLWELGLDPDTATDGDVQEALRELGI